MFNDIRGDVISGSDSLLQAVQKREFKPYIQPIVCVSNHKIISGELLVRWHTSDGEVICPDSFINNMEKAGILSRLTCFTTNEAITNSDGESKFNGESFILHVSVAPSLLHSKKFISICIRVTEKNSLSLVLELAEQYFFTAGSKAISAFHFLKESSMQLVLDDFGTGYSNLFYLECPTVDFIKVGKIFTQDLERYKQSHYIVETILRLSEKLNIKTIIEGVENMELANKLALPGIGYFQGYYFGQAIELYSSIKEYRGTV